MKSNVNLIKYMQQVRRVIYSVSFYIDRIFQRSTPNVVVLCYHSIDDNEWLFNTSLEDFKKQMEYMCNKYEPVTLDDVVNHVRGSATLHKPSFAVTFDDGYKNILRAKDILSELGIQPTAFLISDMKHANRNELDTKHELLSSDDVKILQSSGWDIGCHSATHNDLTKIDVDNLIDEIKSARNALINAYDIPVKHFAYPKGAYTDTVCKSVQDAGFDAAFSVDDRIISASNNLFTIPRIGINQTHTLGEFKQLSSPLVTFVRCISKKILHV